jgi:hypothetical protein
MRPLDGAELSTLKGASYLETMATQASEVKTGVRRRCLATLLMFLSLIVGSGSAAAAQQAGDPAARVGRERQGSAIVFVRAPDRKFLSDDAQEPKAKSGLAPPRPGIVTDRLGIRPVADAGRGLDVHAVQPRAVSYRARAPPAA